MFVNNHWSPENSHKKSTESKKVLGCPLQSRQHQGQLLVPVIRSHAYPSRSHAEPRSHPRLWTWSFKGNTTPSITDWETIPQPAFQPTNSTSSLASTRLQFISPHGVLYSCPALNQNLPPDSPNTSQECLLQIGSRREAGTRELKWKSWERYGKTELS